MKMDITGMSFLDDCSNEELDPLVQIIVKRGGFNEGLTYDDDYRKNYPNHRAYVRLIQQEILEYGNNSFSTLFDYLFSSTLGITYKQILMDVCGKMDISYNSSDSIEKIENQLLGKTFEGAFKDLSDSDKKAIVYDLEMREGLTDKISASNFIKLFNMGGFESYKMSVIIANSISKLIVGKGLSLAANAALTKGLSILVSAPVAWLTTLWGLYSAAGPNYKVTIPAVTYIAAIRRTHEHG